MGGFGSGGHNTGLAGNAPARGVTEDHLTLCANRLTRIGVFKSAAPGVLEWPDETGRIFASVRYRLERTQYGPADGLHLILDYAPAFALNKGLDGFLSLATSETPTRVERIEVEPYRPPYGGFRYWFRCPRCHHRGTKLHLKNDRFLCRKTCHNLTWRSVREAHREARQLAKFGVETAGPGGKELRRTLRDLRLLDDPRTPRVPLHRCRLREVES